MSKPYKRLSTIKSEMNWGRSPYEWGPKVRSELKSIFRRKQRRALNDITRNEQDEDVVERQTHRP